MSAESEGISEVSDDFNSELWQPHDHFCCLLAEQEHHAQPTFYLDQIELVP